MCRCPGYFGIYLFGVGDGCSCPRGSAGLCQCGVLCVLARWSLCGCVLQMFSVFLEVIAAYVFLGVFGVDVSFNVLTCAVVVSCLCCVVCEFLRWVVLWS